MERGNRAIKALQELQYLDSLEDERRALLLEKWVQRYVIDKEEPFYNSLAESQKIQLSELYFKNISFLKNQIY